MNIRCESADENSWVSSPKFGKINEDLKLDVKSRYSFQDSKSKHKFDLEGRI
jgi:hypothetical protein